MVVLSRLFDWRGALVVVKPDTLIRWHRGGLRRSFGRAKAAGRGTVSDVRGRIDGSGGAGAWAACLEAGGRYGGTATGFMNTASSISAFVSPLAAAWLFDRFGSFAAMFWSAAIVYFLAGLLWLKIDATQSLDS